MEGVAGTLKGAVVAKGCGGSTMTLSFSKIFFSASLELVNTLFTHYKYHLIITSCYALPVLDIISDWLEEAH